MNQDNLQILCQNGLDVKYYTTLAFTLTPLSGPSSQ